MLLGYQVEKIEIGISYKDNNGVISRCILVGTLNVST